jgi:hypothetical protein
MSSMPGSNWWNLFHKEVKSWDSTTWFRIWQFQTPALKRYLQMPLLAERFVFWRWWSGFLKEGVKTNLMTLMSPHSSPTFFCLHIYSLWPDLTIPYIIILIYTNEIVSNNLIYFKQDLKKKLIARMTWRGKGKVRFRTTSFFSLSVDSSSFHLWRCKTTNLWTSTSMFYSHLWSVMNAWLAERWAQVVRMYIYENHFLALMSIFHSLSMFNCSFH